MQGWGDRTRWTLVAAARGGDEDAARALYQQYKGPVVACIALRGLPGEAEDLAQEVFLRLFEHGVLDRATKSKGRFRSLIFALTKNVIGNHVSRATAQKRGAGGVRRLGDRVDVPSPGEDDLEQTFRREWLLALLDRALAKLETHFPLYHQALDLFMFNDQSQDKVAVVMNTTPNAVRNYVHRGKRKLLSYLRQEIWSYSSSKEEFAEELEGITKHLAG